MAEKTGITTTRKTPVIHPMPNDRENLKLSKDQFIEKRKKIKKANAAAEEARRKSLAESGINETDQEKNDKKENLTAQIQDLKPKIKAAKEAADAKPDSKAAQKKLADLQRKLEEAENALDELESK